MDITVLFILISFLCVQGGEKVLLHFIQDSPGDYLPLEEISKAVGISATAKAGQRPVVRRPTRIISQSSALKSFARDWNESVEGAELMQRWTAADSGLRQEAGVH